MEVKKNPKVDLTKKSTLFLQLGLIVVLFVSWQAIEWKNYEKQLIDYGDVTFNDIIEEEIPMSEVMVEPPPPPKKIAPEVIEVVPDEVDIPESPIESSEPDNEVPEIIPEEIPEEPEEPEDIDVPFFAVEDVPIFPGCENAGGKKAIKKCMTDKINKFVRRKFNTDLSNDLGLKGLNRISVIFSIDKNGDIVGIKARGPHPRLEKEAQRVINMLPKMTPGKQRGKPVNVSYSLPIVFKVNN